MPKLRAASRTVRALGKRLLDPNDMQAAFLVSFLLIVHEMIVCSFIVSNVSYTEIDWKVRNRHTAKSWSAIVSGSRDSFDLCRHHDSAKE